MSNFITVIKISLFSPADFSILLRNIMDERLPFFNWSLRKALDSEPDSLAKARFRIIYAILLFSLLKGVIVLGFGIAQAQWPQVARATMAMAFYVIITKILLFRPDRIKLLTHITIQLGLFFVVTNIFVYAHKVNLISLQFIFMIMLCSFYILGSRLGVIYSILSIIPVLLILIFPGLDNISFALSGQEFPSPGFEIIVVLNFISIILTHYLFYDTLNENIKEKERLNEELKLTAMEAHKLAESRSNFLSTISHELRTPLNSVIGIAELLMDDKPEERQKENLKILHYSAIDLLSLINNVLDFNKIDSDKLVLEAIPFRVAEFMENICLGLRIKATDKKLNFALEIDERLKKTNVLSDPTRLSQLIYNLVSNAIKFTDAGSVSVKLECIDKTDNNVNILFSVSDTGIGIHPDRHEKIFDLFTQAESDITRKYGGTGLGLAIVKQVLALFGSEIQLESIPGSGARFFFTISFATAANASEQDTQLLPEKSDFSQLKILVAEDNILNRMIIKKQFDKLDVDVVMVENGRLAYDAVMSGDFNAVFIDLHMPEQDGYETATQIRASNLPGKAGLYLVAFTASVNEQQKILDYGFDDYLYKPVDMQSLREKLARIVGKTAPELL